MEILFSFHSRQRMLLRGIEESTVIYILKNPDFVDESFDGRKIAVKKLEKTWHVVFAEEAGRIIVISVFFF